LLGALRMQRALGLRLPAHDKKRLRCCPCLRRHTENKFTVYWEVSVPEFETSVFIIPGRRVKNGDDRLVVLNRVARSVIEEVRGQHPDYVFTFDGRPMTRVNNSAWRKARVRAGLPFVRVHDLKHTFGRRLRAAGVSFEDRQDLLGHRSGRITTHYSAVELKNLIDAANKVHGQKSRKSPALVLLKRKTC
ncbi:MAG: tyrosine-type recombinase/integrase, partial [Chromatiales bacterium]